MTQVIDYFFAPNSPWSYLGHARLVALAKQYGATVVPKPMNLGEVFPVSGGLPLPKRSPQRQAYRLAELERWSAHLGITIHIKPKHFPVDANPASLWIIAATEQGNDAGLAMAHAAGRAVWELEQDIADPAVLAGCARAAALDPAVLAAGAPAMAERYAALTQEAIERGVFGAPTYLVDGEMFWGQDRLDFLARKLAK